MIFWKMENSSPSVLEQHTKDLAVVNSQYLTSKDSPKLKLYINMYQTFF